MYLIQSWKDSLSLFKSKNFNLFALVTLKTIVEAYGLLLKYFWWLPVLVVAVMFVPIQQGIGVEEGTGLFYWLVGLFFFAWEIITCLVVRPSVAKKDYAYFTKYLLHIPSIIMGFLLIYLVEFLWMLFFVVGCRLGLDCSIDMIWVNWHTTLLSILSNAVALALIPLKLFFLFFVIDMSLGFKNILKGLLFALKMFWYNAPALYLIIGVYAVVLNVFVALLGLVLSGQAIALLFLFLPILTKPIGISIMNNFYIKRLHEQPQLFFKQPNE